MSSTIARSSPHLLPSSSATSDESPAIALQRDLERLFFEQWATEPLALDVSTGLFIIGAPRTGSTVLYQAAVRFLGLPYISNFCNEVFANFPILGAPALQAMHHPGSISLDSAYGKTRGSMQPSEASGVMRHWFGGGHPSQVRSAAILPDKADHMRKTLLGYRRIFNAPLVTKNPWNCFRIASIARELPGARFIWLRRDIAAAALSDLSARYVVQGRPDVWNSATPANYEQLQRDLPPWAQVVENQYEFSRAIADALAPLGPTRAVEVWYEDLLAEPDRTVARMAELAGRPVLGTVTLEQTEKPPRALQPDDERYLRDYIHQHRDRFSSGLKG